MWKIIIIAVALAMDAFGVSLGIGINNSIIKKHKIRFAMSFGFFQFFLCFLGAIGGYIFSNYVASIPNILGGIVISLVGLFMIKEGMEQKDDSILLNPKMYLVLGISVSIDALVVGFTIFNNINNMLYTLGETLFIGIVTFLLCLSSFYLSRYVRKITFMARYADYFGGIILIIFGMRMIFLR